MPLSATIHHLSNVKLNQIVRDPDNPRHEVEVDDGIRELARSIESVGLLQPVVVRPIAGSAGRFMLVAGERRTAAARVAGLKDIPAIIRSDFDDNGAAQEAMLVENLQRKDLDPIEEACGYSQLVDRGWTQAKIAQRVGVAQGTISKRLRLLDLPGEVLAFVSDGKCSISDALELATVVDQPTVLKGALIEAKRYAGKDKGLADVGRAIRQQLQLEERQRENDDHSDHLQSLGMSIVAGEPPKKGWERLNLFGSRKDFKIPKPHKADCLTAHLSTYGGWEYYCKAPKTHPKPKDPQADREADERRRWKLLKETTAPRREFVAASILRPMPFSRADLTALLTWAAIYGTGGAWTTFTTALRLLGVLDETGNKALIRHAQLSSTSGQERVAIAVVCATIEEHIDVKWNRWEQRELAYFDLLTKHGYQVTEVEQLKLDEATKMVGILEDMSIDDINVDEASGEILGIDGPIEVSA